MYSQNGQKESIGNLIGSSQTEAYIPGGTVYLARGHLAPNADYMYYAWQVISQTDIVK